MIEPTPAQRHQQEVFRKIRLPVVVGAGLLLAVLVGLFVLSQTGDVSSQQIRCLMGGLVVLCILLPLVIIMLVVNVLFMMLALGSGSLYGLLKPPLVATREYVDQGTAMTKAVSERMTEPVIKARTQVAYWRKMVLLPLGLDTPQEEKDNEGQK